MTKRIIAILLVLSLAFGLFSCTGKDKGGDDTKKEETTENLAGADKISALDVFSDAAKELSEMTMLKKEITVKTERSVGNQTYEESVECSVDLMNVGGEDFTAVATEKRVLDSGIVDTVETFSGGKVYCKYGDDSDGTFVSDMDAETFLSRYLPTVIIDGELYDSASYAKDDKSTVVFAKAKGLEKWLAPEYATLTKATAEVKLSDKNEIEKMVYSVEYTQGPAHISSEYTVKISESTSIAADVKIPAAEECIELSEIDIPMYIAYAENGIKNSNTLVGTSYNEIVIPEGGIAYTSNDKYDLYTGDDVFVSKIDRNITVQSVNGTQKTSVIDEYKDKKATQIINEGEPKETETKPADFKKYIREDLSTFLYEPTVFASAEVIHADEFVLIEYTIANDSAIGASCEDYVSEFIYGDADFFDQYSEGYATNELGGYIAMDKDTLLPTAIGFTYKGCHTVEGEAVNMLFSASQSIACGTDEAYTDVTDEYLPEPEPEKKATPLLYEVTAPNGAKMYLLGTIHVADARAAYLPDELYAALDEADVLAVEVDPNTFEDKILADDKLMTMLQESYYYQDGTTIKDHVSEEIYEYGVTAMKIAGEYFSHSDMMRPSLWSSTLDYFLMDTSMVLNSFKGIDERLLKIAKESGKTIRDIETVEGRLSMELSYPEKAHELLLESSLSFYRAEVVADCFEMYELWCEGDEKKLMEYLREEEEYSEDVTEEEIAAYEEYNRIMVTDRDAIMIDAAKKYLENTEEVVFYAVGMAHVLGETGLVDALREAGYTVTAVEYK